MTGILDAKLDIKMGFQGIRIDTLVNIDDDTLDLCCKAGCRYLQFGVESGSPRIQKLIHKEISLEDVVTTNRRLAAHPEIVTFYNFMCAFPTETKEDLFQSTKLAWQILKENKRAMISAFHHFKPYPGTELAKASLDENFPIPDSLESWATFDWTNAFFDEGEVEKRRLFRRVEMTSMLADKNNA